VVRDILISEKGFVELKMGQSMERYNDLGGLTAIEVR
jgi:hypothetical protein